MNKNRKNSKKEINKNLKILISQKLQENRLNKKKQNKRNN